MFLLLTLIDKSNLYKLEAVIIRTFNCYETVIVHIKYNLKHI